MWFETHSLTSCSADIISTYPLQIALMALNAPADMIIASEMPATRPAAPTEIADDVLEEAVEASRYPSDGEDPYEPQPKMFMQTEIQKARRKRKLEVRKVARTLRGWRKAFGDAKVDNIPRQRLKQTQRPSPIDRLPSELILKLMQHTHVLSLRHLANTCMVHRSIFNANGIAVMRGIEIEQFLEWKWLFGYSQHRTPAQSQHLKSGFIAEFSCNPCDCRWKNDKKVIQALQVIDDNKFTGLMNVMFLQEIQNRLDSDIRATESYMAEKMATKIARRTAMCLRTLSFRIPSILEAGEDDVRFTFVPTIVTREQRWEARSQLIIDQPASIQAEIRFILQTLINDLYHRVRKVVMKWTLDHYSTPGNHREPQEVKRWMSNVLTGYILKEVIPRWYRVPECCLPTSGSSGFYWERVFFSLADQMSRFLRAYGQRPMDGIQEVSGGLEFGRQIGLDVDGLLEGTRVGEYVDSWE